MKLFFAILLALLVVKAHADPECGSKFKDNKCSQGVRYGCTYFGKKCWRETKKDYCMVKSYDGSQVTCKNDADCLAKNVAKLQCVGEELPTNEFLDKLLDNVRPTIERELDPIKLPERRHKFSQKILFVTVFGEASVWNGYVSGLNNIRRSGEATMNQEGDSLIVKAHLGIHDLKGQYSAKATFMSLGPNFTAYLGISSVSVRLGVKQALKPDSYPDLFDFEIEDISGITVNISGLGPLGWILGGLTTFIANILNEVIAIAVNDPIKNVIRNELKKVKIPF